MLVRQWINFSQDGITAKVIPENIAEEALAYNSNCLIFLYLWICWFFRQCLYIFVDKTNPSAPHKREDYWRRTLKTMAPFELKCWKKWVTLWVLTFIYFCLYWSLMAYMSARTGSVLGLENLDAIITIVCSEVSFGGGSCHVETGRLVCVAG